MRAALSPCPAEMASQMGVDHLPLMSPQCSLYLCGGLMGQGTALRSLVCMEEPYC